jgi:hypothetical protein
MVSSPQNEAEAAMHNVRSISMWVIIGSALLMLGGASLLPLV